MMRRDIAPLSAGFMMTSIAGIIISAIYFQKFGPTWGTTFLIFFAIMFLASIRSMTYGPSIEELKLDEQLAEYKQKIHEQKKAIRAKHKAARKAAKIKKKKSKKRR